MIFKSAFGVAAIAMLLAGSIQAAKADGDDSHGPRVIFSFGGPDYYPPPPPPPAYYYAPQPVYAAPPGYYPAPEYWRHHHDDDEGDDDWTPARQPIGIGLVFLQSDDHLIGNQAG